MAGKSFWLPGYLFYQAPVWPVCQAPRGWGIRTRTNQTKNAAAFEGPPRELGLGLLLGVEEILRVVE
jgi:hypothetical protein